MTEARVAHSWGLSGACCLREPCESIGFREAFLYNSGIESGKAGSEIEVFAISLIMGSTDLV